LRNSLRFFKKVTAKNKTARACSKKNGNVLLFYVCVE